MAEIIDIKTKKAISVEEDDTLYNQYIKLKPFLRILPSFEKQGLHQKRILPKCLNEGMKEFSDLRFSVHQETLRICSPKKLDKTEDWSIRTFKIGRVDENYAIIIWDPNNIENREPTFFEFLKVYTNE